MSWYEVAKDAISMAQKAGNIPLVQQILDMQREMQDMQQENFDLKKKIAKLEEADSHEIEYDEKRSAVYEIMEDGSKQGPYCTRCWEVDKNLVSVHKIEDEITTSYYCPHCENNVTIEVREADFSSMYSI